MNMDNNITQLIFELQNIEYDMNVSLQKSKNTFSKIKNFLQYIRKLELNNSKLIGNIDNLNEIISKKNVIISNLKNELIMSKKLKLTA
jgi:hypothetical protein